MFKPVEQLPRYRLVAHQIAGRIADGSLQPGQKMPAERELVESLGVSRPTVREALIALEVEGYVESRFGAGMYVAARPPVSGQLGALAGPGPFELLEARLLIEGEIAAVAASLISEAETARLANLTQAMAAESGDRFWGENADEEFHLTIAQATRNKALEDIAREFWRQRMRLPMWVQMHNRINVADMKPELVAEHEAIVAALKAHDPVAARAAMRRHISKFAEQLLNAWERLEASERDTVPPPGEGFQRALSQG